MERTTKKQGFQRLFSTNNFKAKNQYIQGVLDKISHCHTAALGYHCYWCNNVDCLDAKTQYHSCGNRLCPFCGTMKKDQWVGGRISDLLPTPYYHIVFTIPHDWNKVMMQSPRELYTILFEAVSQTLLCLRANPAYLGATPGITAGVSSWIIMYTCIVWSQVVG